MADLQQCVQASDKEILAGLRKLQACCINGMLIINTLRPRQNGRHLPDAIFNCIFLNENI